MPGQNQPDAYPRELMAPQTVTAPMRGIEAIFADVAIDPGRLAEVEALRDPRSRYFIAITPRSGSSWLCDVMTRTRRFGRPHELISEQHIPHLIKNIPGRTPEAYLRHVLRARCSGNGVSGLKASWFQFEKFLAAMRDHACLEGFRWVYLTRRNLALQAVSLYKAVETTVFHANRDHPESALERLAALEYDYEGIATWYAHILAQETGWQDYFYRHRIFPLCLTYEDIEQDLFGVLKRIATYVGVKPDNVPPPATPSVFRRVSDKRNAEWALRFERDRWQRERLASPAAPPHESSGVTAISVADRTGDPTSGAATRVRDCAGSSGSQTP